MNIVLIAFLLGGILTYASPVLEADLKEWEIFKLEHDKEYANEEEEQKRQSIYFNNLKFVRDHNKRYRAGKETYSVEINKFSDMTSDEFASRVNGLRGDLGMASPSSRTFETSSGKDLPKSVDWRKKGCVTPVKNQGMCGSCWAFSATGSLETQWCLKNKKLVSLSEQNLVDCSHKEGNNGCAGGWMDYAFRYIEINKGIDTEKAYPYKGRNGKCKYQPKNKGATDLGFLDIESEDEQALQAVVATVGPASVAIDASHNSFQQYRKGIYQDKRCSRTVLDHGVLVVGYGTLNNQDYWLVKNSWGTDWGMNGYFLMARNKNNMCGIATNASVPLVA